METTFKFIGRYQGSKPWYNGEENGLSMKFESEDGVTIYLSMYERDMQRVKLNCESMYEVSGNNISQKIDSVLYASPTDIQIKEL